MSVVASFYSSCYHADREGTVLDARDLGFAPLPIDFDFTSLSALRKELVSATHARSHIFRKRRQ